MKKYPYFVPSSAPPSVWRRVWLTATGCVWLGALCLSAPAQAAADREDGPNPPLLRPLKVVSTSGNVQNAEALVDGHGGYATLTWGGQGPAPMVILGYGRDVGGLPFFEVAGASGTPQLQALYSETQQYLLPGGDAASNSPQDPTVAQPETSFVGDAAGANLARAETHPLSQPGLLVDRLIQGGERFEALTLTTPGSVTLRRVGIQLKFFIPQPALNRGRFACSDPALNEIWALGAYAVELCSVPVRSLPPKWTVTPEGVKVRGSEYCAYQDGVTWTDYTARFDVQVLANEAAWLVRANDYNGVRVVLAADNDALGISRPNTVRAYVQFTKTPLGEASVPDVQPGSWHRVRNEVSGSTVRVYLDEALVLTLALPSGGGPFGSVEAGSVSFGNQGGAEALFRNLVVTDAQGLVAIPGPFGGPATADTLTNAHFHGALLQAAQLATALGQADAAAGYTATAAQLRAAINVTLFNPSTGLYDVDTAQPGVADQHGNAYAVLYGVAPAPSTSVADLLQKLTAALYRTPTAPNAPGPVPVQQSSGSTQVGPYTSAYEVFARFDSGDAAGALALIRNEWGLMRHTSPYYSGATWEYVALDGTPGLGESTSLAHGWGSGPTSALSKYVLGVRPVQPGYQTFLVEPQPGDLGWAAGTVPTRYGPIAVSWQATSQGLRLEVWVPQGTRGTVGIPVSGASAALSDNGRTVTAVSAANEPNGRAGYLYLESVRPGAHVIQVATGND